MQKSLYFIFLLFLSFSCYSQQNIEKSEQQLVKIIYSNYGGSLGWSETLVITQNSVNYNSNLLATNKKSRLDTTISTDEWNKLVSFFDLKTFKSIHNGPSRLPIDGTDTKYTVVLNSGEKYSFVNGKDLSINKKIISFLELIQSIKKTIINKIKE